MKLDRGKAFWGSTPTEQTVKQKGRAARFVRGFVWPVCVLSLGLLATLAWIALLGWLLYRAALAFGVG